MSFPINVNVPNGPNNPSDDQPEMKTNYANISGFLSVDHVNPGATFNGIHKQVHLINQAAPGLVGSGGVLYSNIQGGQAWPFWQNASGIVQLISGLPSFANGITTLSGGIVLQWGIQVLPGPGTVNFLNTFPTNAPIVIVSLQANAATSSSNTISVLGTPSTTSFQYNFTGTTSYNNFYWLAIGN